MGEGKERNGSILERNGSIFSSNWFGSPESEVRSAVSLEGGPARSRGYAQSERENQQGLIREKVAIGVGWALRALLRSVPLFCTPGF